MRYYETAFLIAPTLSEEETEQFISQMESVVKKKKGRMIHIDKWGKRKLAYPIKRNDSAFYVFFYYEGGPETYTELERQFKQKEAVIRYLTFKRDEEPSFKGEDARRERTAREEKPQEPEKPEEPEKEEGPEKEKKKANPDKKKSTKAGKEEAEEKEGESKKDKEEPKKNKEKEAESKKDKKEGE